MREKVFIVLFLFAAGMFFAQFTVKRRKVKEKEHTLTSTQNRKTIHIMFDEVPDQFHQFISSSSAPPAITLPLPFPPLHHASSTLSPSHFDPLLFLHPAKISQDRDVGCALNMERSIHPQNPWSSEEVLALLRVRSSLENWFPGFTWEHVSRKLADLGFQINAEKCKEKFDEESKKSKNFRIFSELEELCHGDQHNNLPEKSKISSENPNDDADEYEPSRETFVVHCGHSKPELADSTQSIWISDDKYQKKTNYEKKVDEELAKSKKKRKENKLQKFKEFCEDVVNKMLGQQEEFHSKLLEDMVRRDEEKVVREEAWKKQEMERIDKELELRAKEQAIAKDRQATLVEFLSKFVPNANFDIISSSSASSTLLASQSQSQSQDTILDLPISKIDHQLFSPSSSLNEPNPNSPLAPTTTPKAPLNPNSPKTSIKEDLGKRWPKEQVLALIDLRRGAGEEKGSGLKVPLWERISQGMMELGYKRSAKRCKEKWENINKYFRKTKHNSKKRSLDSRTCPYFHQLSTLYNQGTLMAPLQGKETSPAVALSGSHSHSPTPQVPSFDFQV